jgi:hypothetical protein
MPFRIISGHVDKHADAAHALALLPACRKRPCRRRAAEQRDELAPSHVLLSAEVLKTITAPEEISRCAAQQIQAA